MRKFETRWNINTSSWVGGCSWDLAISISHLPLAICFCGAALWRKSQGELFDRMLDAKTRLCFNKAADRMWQTWRRTGEFITATGWCCAVVTLESNLRQHSEATDGAECACFCCFHLLGEVVRSAWGDLHATRESTNPAYNYSPMIWSVPRIIYSVLIIRWPRKRK